MKKQLMQITAIALLAVLVVLQSSCSKIGDNEPSSSASPIEAAIADWVGDDTRRGLQELLCTADNGLDKVCIYSTQNEGVSVIYLENKATADNPDYDTYLCQTYDVTNLTYESTEFKEFCKRGNKKVVYNIYYNPTTTEVEYDGEKASVYTAILNYRKIGVWCLVVDA